MVELQQSHRTKPVSMVEDLVDEEGENTGSAEVEGEAQHISLGYSVVRARVTAGLDVFGESERECEHQSEAERE